MVSVVVVGASAAGLVAALELTRGGARTVLVEGRKSPGRSPADTVIDSMATRCGVEIPRGSIINRVKGFRLISPSGSVLDFPSTGVKLDREAFDRHYVSAIEDAGGEVRLGIKVESLHLEGGDVTRVRTRRGDKKEDLECDVLVVASGFENPWLDSLQLTPVRHPQDVARGVQVDMDGVDVDQDHFEFLLGQSIAPGWKAAISPITDGQGTAGVYIRGREPGIEDLFLEKLLSASPASDKLQGGKVLRKYRGSDPFATIPKQLVHRNVMMVGSACGQTGLPYGMAAGKMAAGTIINSGKDGISKYQDRWMTEFLSDFTKGRTAIRILERLEDAELDALFKAMDDVGLENMDVGRVGDVLHLGGSLLRREPQLFFRIIRISLGLGLA